jgi:GNAT superfamily N-acetyltransferase
MPDEFLAGLSVQEREPGWRKIIDATGSMSFVCRSQRQTVGFAACGSTRDADKDPAVVGELYAIYVLPGFWGRGYGHALWRRVGRELILAKFKEVNLWFSTAMLAAGGFTSVRDSRSTQLRLRKHMSAVLSSRRCASGKDCHVSISNSIYPAIITRPFAGGSERWQLSPIFTDKM